MAATNDDDSVVSYGQSITNFGTAYAATQESFKLQGTTIASMQSQLNAMTQYCMALQQQSTPTNHAAQQQRGVSINWCGLVQFNGNSSGGGYQQPAYPQPGVTGQRPDYTPTPHKRFKNWDYCPSHGGNVDNRHTSRMCIEPGPTHNPNVTRTNMMNGLPAGRHKTSLPLTSGHAPHVLCQQRAPVPASWQQPPSPVNFTKAMVQMMTPAPYHQMHYMGQKFGPTPPPAAQLAPPAPAPLAGTLMVPYYPPYLQPHLFQ
jgi:hypothetical protein